MACGNEKREMLFYTYIESASSSFRTFTPDPPLPLRGDQPRTYLVVGHSLHGPIPHSQHSNPITTSFTLKSCSGILDGHLTPLLSFLSFTPPLWLGIIAPRKPWFGLGWEIPAMTANENEGNVPFSRWFGHFFFLWRSGDTFCSQVTDVQIGEPCFIIPKGHFLTL